MWAPRAPNAGELPLSADPGDESGDHISPPRLAEASARSSPKVLHDEDLAQAIVDRVLERGRLLTLDGQSMWTRHLGLDDVTSRGQITEATTWPGFRNPPARVSGSSSHEPVRPFTGPHWPVRLQAHTARAHGTSMSAGAPYAARRTT